jgi:hypothetical protein
VQTQSSSSPLKTRKTKKETATKEPIEVITPGPYEYGLRWRPLSRAGSVIPWGYKQDPDNPDILWPIPEMLEKLEEAKIYLGTHGFRPVAEWLSQETGVNISPAGLRVRVLLERRRNNQQRVAVQLAERLYKAIASAKELEEKLGHYGYLTSITETEAYRYLQSSAGSVPTESGTTDPVPASP